MLYIFFRPYVQVSDISSLKDRKASLKALSMYKLKLPGVTSERIVETLSELTELAHLDVSDEPESNPANGPYPNIPGGGNKLKINQLLSDPKRFPKLTSLDISGTKINLNIRGYCAHSCSL